MSLGESWYGAITGRPRPTPRMSSAPGGFLLSASGENARDLSAHTDTYKNAQRWLCVTCDRRIIWWKTADHWTAGLDYSKSAQVKTLKLSQHNPCIKSSIFSVQKHSAVKVLIHDSCQCSSKRSSTALKVQTALTFESTASDYNLQVCIWNERPLS